jgi:hypothetical protein
MRLLIPVVLLALSSCANDTGSPSDASVGAQCGPTLICMAGERCCHEGCGGGYQVCFAGSVCPQDSCDMGTRD